MMTAFTPRSEALRVLVIAPCCDGTDVGEARSTCEWVTRIAGACDATVLSYQKRSRPSVASQVAGARVVEWRDLPFVGRWERFNSMAKPGYAWFYIAARRWLKRALRRGERFDIIHQLSPLALRYPSPGVGLGIPLIVGPLGGSLSTPEPFRGECGSEAWYVRARAVDHWRLRHDRLLRRTYESSDVVIGVAPYVAELLGSLRVRRFEWMSETGVRELAAPPERTTGGSPFRLLFVGRIVRTKGLRDLIRAMQHLRHLPICLDVLGDGDDRQACMADMHRLGLASHIKFHGRVNRDEVESFYRVADVFVFPSFREPSGNVVFEALSHGLPLIVADRGGPGFVVDDSCGIRVPVTDPERFPRDIATAIELLWANPERLAHLGKGATDRIRTLALWSSKVECLMALYQEVAAMSSSSSNPSARVDR